MILYHAALSKIRLLLETIQFSHSIFALPFALVSLVLASRVAGTPPSPGQVFWICLALIGGRTGAMACNRLIDRRIDGANPRTADRHLPSGKVTVRETAILAVAGFALLLLAAWRLNPLCLALAPPAIGLLVLYSYSKRFTSLSHLLLGLCLALAPAGAWIALRGTFGRAPLLLSLAVLCWVAGFDIFYALQDENFDRSWGLRSIPVRLGTRRAILVAGGLHGLMVLLLVLLTLVIPVGKVFMAGILLVAALLFYEHRLVRADDLSRIHQAFFTINGLVSVSLLLFVLVDVAVTWN